MKHYVTTAKHRYLIRGAWTAQEVKQHFAAFKQKYPSSKCSFDEWLVSYGKVYF